MQHKIIREEGRRNDAPQITPPVGYVQIGEWTTSTRHTRDGLCVPKGTSFEEVLKSVSQNTLEKFWGTFFLSGNEIVADKPALIIGVGGKFIKNFPNMKVIRGEATFSPEGAGATIPARGNNEREWYLHYPSSNFQNKLEEERQSRLPKFCSRCGQKIKGGYTIVSGKIVCRRCE